MHAFAFTSCKLLTLMDVGLIFSLFFSLSFQTAIIKGLMSPHSPLGPRLGGREESLISFFGSFLRCDAEGGNEVRPFFSYAVVPINARRETAYHSPFFERNVSLVKGWKCSQAPNLLGEER